jgi:hypothetical protein
MDIEVFDNKDHYVLVAKIEYDYPFNNVFHNINDAIFNLRREINKIAGEKDFFSLPPSSPFMTFYTEDRRVPYRIIHCEGLLLGSMRTSIDVAFRIKQGCQAASNIR